MNGFRHLRSRVETFATLNFCIATSLLYIFYIPSSSGPWSHPGPICALFSALFHATFLLAAFSVSNLLFLTLFRTLSKVKWVHVVALLLNWGKSAIYVASNSYYKPCRSSLDCLGCFNLSQCSILHERCHVSHCDTCF